MHKITVTVDAKRRASAPREAFVIADNNDWLVEFDIDAAAGFNTAAEMTAVLVTARGKLPDITFNDGQITLPRLIEADGGLLYIGVTQGDIKTTGWACVRVQQSIYTKAHGRTAPNPDDPQDYDALPAAEDLALTDEIVVNDVAAGRRERATLAQLQALIGGGGADESIFPVVYGETLHADILEAYEAGKLCVMEYGAETYICTTASAALAAFANLPTAGALTAKRVEVTAADAWSTREVDLPNAADVVMYTAQIKTPAQKLRARQNIGALGGADAAVTVEMTSESFASGSIVNTSAIFSDIVEEVASQVKINFILNDILHFVVAQISDDDEKSMTLFCAPTSAGTGKWYMLTLEPNIDPDTGMSGNLIAFPAPAVSSVNGQTGTVVLDASDVGAMPSAAIEPLITLLEHVVYTDGNGQQYIDDLENALYGRTLSSISAVFTQGSAVIYDTDSLDDLRQYLVVTAAYSDSYTQTVTDYTLSGTLTAGTSTITVTYQEKTDTFNVTVTGTSSPEVSITKLGSNKYSAVYSDDGTTLIKAGASTTWASDETFTEDTLVSITILYGSTNTNLKQYAGSWDGTGTGAGQSDAIDGIYAVTLGSAQTTAYTAQYTVKAGYKLLIKNYNSGTPTSIEVTRG